jgi:hypothetical protein
LLDERNPWKYVSGRCPLLFGFDFAATRVIGLRAWMDLFMLLYGQVMKEGLLSLKRIMKGFINAFCWSWYSEVSRKRLSIGYNALKLAERPSPLYGKICLVMANLDLI